MPKHIINLLVLLGCFSILAIAAKFYLTDPSYYKYGIYRADAVSELAAGTPLYQGSAYCQTCHPNRQADWLTGSHKTVQCEVCHGNAPEHPDDGRILAPTDLIRLCTTCHLAMPARPDRQPQIVLGEHPFPGEETPPCNTCHNPHSPGDWGPVVTAPDPETQESVQEDAATSAPATASRCAKCHGIQGQGSKRNPALAGLVATDFIERMNMYKSGERTHKMMTKYANTLSDEEIMELASYYENLAEKTPE